MVLMLLAVCRSVVADEPTAEVNRTAVAMQESFTLMVEVTGSGARNQPDLSVLEESFEIVRGSKRTEVKVVDGESQAKTKFFYTLTPKRPGVLKIPALKVGDAATQAITIYVTKAAIVSVDDGAPDLFLEAEVTEQQPLVQSQITYTMRLFQAIDTREGSLSEPELRDAIVIRLGDDVQYEVDRYDRSYLVVERRYAVFPEVSGPITFPSPVFNGQLPEKRELSSLNDLFGQRGGSSGNPFANFFHPTRPVRVEGPQLRIDVQPVPAGHDSSSWLPTSGLELEETWTTRPLTFKVGEPTTRTLIVRARGVTAAHLPEISVESTDEMKVYADRPIIQTLSERDFIIGVRKVKLAMVPTRSGPFTLPPVVIEWWDTTSGMLRRTELPARDIAVLPSDLAEDAVADTPTSGDELGAGPTVLDDGRQPSGAWPLIVIGLSIIWLITFVAWLRARKGKTGQTATTSQPATTSTHSARDLRRACVNNQAWPAKEALIDWAAERWGSDQPQTLTAVALCVSSSETSKALMELDGILYDGNESTWTSGAHLWSCLQSETGEKKDRKSKGGSRLPALYPG